MKSIAHIDSKNHASSQRSFSSDRSFQSSANGRNAFFQKSGVQAKLSVSKPGDPLETEADDIADRAVERISGFHGSGAEDDAVDTREDDIPVISRKCAGCEHEELQRQEDHHQEPLDSAMLAEREEDYGADDEVQLKCAGCEKEDTALQSSRWSPELAGVLQRQALPEQPKEEIDQYAPLAEVFFARKGSFPVAIPKTATSVQHLARYLFKAANDEAEEGVAATSTLVQHIKNLNGLLMDDLYEKQQVLLGDLPMKYAFTDKAVFIHTNGPIFSPDTVDPELELQKMGVSTIGAFIIKKRVLDNVVSIDIGLLKGVLRQMLDGNIFRQEGLENLVMSILKKWIAEPLSRLAIYYPKGGEYFDKVLLGLTQDTFVMHNVFTDEWTSSYNVMFNRFVYRKDELNTYKKSYSYLFKDDKPIRELSLWDDFAKPAVMRVPGAITEEVGCFVKSLPFETTKKMGDKLHDVAANYLDTVLSEEKEVNAQTLEIACTFGEIVFDLAGSVTKIKKVIDALQAADDLYKTYKEVSGAISNLPDILVIFEDPDKFIDVVLGLDDSGSLQKIEDWATTEDSVAAPATGSQSSGLAKFRKVVAGFINLVKKILRPVFAIRKRFLQFIDDAQQALAGNPLFMKFLLALKAGKKIKDLLKGGLQGTVADILVSLLAAVKEKAADFVQGLGEQVMGAVDGIKAQLEQAISEFAIYEIEKIGGTIKATLKIPMVREKVNKLISGKLIDPFLRAIGLNTVMDKIRSVISMVNTKVTAAIDYLVDNLKTFIAENLQNLNLQLKAKEGEGNKTGLEDMVQSNMKASSAGQLMGEVRTKMELGLGRGLPPVNIHTDRAAAEASEALNARAFTRSNDIYFNAGQYRPESRDGQKLLAHELTHVVQQANGELLHRSLKDAPDKLWKKILKGINLRKDPRVKKFAAAMQMPTVSFYPLDRYSSKVTLDKELTRRALERRRKLLGTIKSSFVRNIAIAKVYIEGSKAPKYITTVNDPNSSHSEELVGAKLYALVKKGKKVQVEQLYSERKPCSDKCVPFMRNHPEWFGGAALFYSVNEERGREANLMRAYGLTEEVIAEIDKGEI